MKNIRAPIFAAAYAVPRTRASWRRARQVRHPIQAGDHVVVARSDRIGISLTRNTGSATTFTHFFIEFIPAQQFASAQDIGTPQFEEIATKLSARLVMVDYGITGHWRDGLRRRRLRRRCRRRKDRGRQRSRGPWGRGIRENGHRDPRPRHPGSGSRMRT